VADPEGREFQLVATSDLLITIERAANLNTRSTAIVELEEYLDAI
jgi:hypothetical protein